MAHGWVKDVDNEAVMGTPDKIEKMKSPLSLYPLLMWRVLKFPQLLNKDYNDNKRSNEKIKGALPLAFFRQSDSHKVQSRGSLMDPLASGLIG